MSAAWLAPFAAQIEKDAQHRYARWDPGQWRVTWEGSARKLLRGLVDSGLEAHRAQATVRSYLRLASEGIGRGYLFPSQAAGCDSFFSLAFTRLIPDHLAAIPHAKQAEVLAACFNLGENLESQPPWLRRIFLRLCRDLTSLNNIEGLVAGVGRQAIDPPAKPLREPVTAHWISLATEDHRFLPGAMHFLAPTVLCVHDRLRSQGGGRAASTCGVWLVDKPLLLGSIPCEEQPETEQAGPPELISRALAGDCRFTGMLGSVANVWRAAVTLVSSQMLVGLLPR